MAKTTNPLIKGDRTGLIIRSKRTIKKSGGDNFVYNARHSAKLKAKKKKIKLFYDLANKKTDKI